MVYCSRCRDVYRSGHNIHLSFGQDHRIDAALMLASRGARVPLKLWRLSGAIADKTPQLQYYPSGGYFAADGY